MEFLKRDVKKTRYEVKIKKKGKKLFSWNKEALESLSDPIFLGPFLITFLMLPFLGLLFLSCATVFK